MASPSWLLLTYKVPPDPAAKRIALWRRLKGLGAVYLQNGVCLLPKTDDHVRRLKMLENDIPEMGGEAVILEKVGLDRRHEHTGFARSQARRSGWRVGARLRQLAHGCRVRDDPRAPARLHGVGARHVGSRCGHHRGHRRSDGLDNESLLRGAQRLAGQA